ncbi:MAG: hypothetical protein R3D34_06835 [Nitratireductor sp.]
MTILDRVQARIGTDIDEGELLSMIDAAMALLVERHGPASGEITVERRGGQPVLMLARPIDQSQPVTIVEHDPRETGDAADATELGTSDYRILNGGRTLERLTGGTNYRAEWGPLVVITYSVKDRTVAYEEAVIGLVAIGLRERGITSEKAGDWSASYGDPDEAREKIIAGLGQSGGMVMA